MKKSLIVLVIILSFTFNLQAEELDSKVTVRGGAKYNNYLYKKYDIREIDGSEVINLDSDYFVREDLHQGVGYYGEVIYYFNQNLGAGIGFQKSTMTAEWQSSGEINQSCKYICNLDSYYAKFIYTADDNFNPYINLTYNLYNEHYSKENFASDMKRGVGPGIMMGTEIHYNLTDETNFILDAGYQITNINIREKYSSYQGEIVEVDNELLQINGLQVRGGISYKF